MDSQIIVSALAQQSVVIAAFCLLGLLATWTLRKQSAHWRYLLWLVVLAKCFTPTLMGFPVPFALHEQTANEKPTNASQSNSVRPNVALAASERVPEFAGTATEEPLNSVPAAVSFRRADSVLANSASSTNLTLTGKTKRQSIAPFSLPQFAVVAWVTIAGILLFRLAGMIWATERKLRRTRRTMPELDVLLKCAASDLGMRSPPKLYVCDEVAQPLVWGLLRGNVYIPRNFTSSSTAAQRHVILKHELAHVGRWDASINLIQSIAAAVYFFHPLVWLANKRIRQEREKCCDEIVLADRRIQPFDYCEAIVAILDHQSQQAKPSVALTATGSTSNVEDRIETILSPGRSFALRPSNVFVGFVFLVAACILPLGFAIAPAKAQTEVANEADTDTQKQNAAERAAKPTSTWKKGQVLDFGVITASGAPIPGVKLTLQNIGKGMTNEDTTHFTTNTNGRAQLVLSDLPPAIVYVFTSAEGFVPQRVYWKGSPHVVLPEKITIPMERAQSIGGLIHDEAGEPIPGVEVRVQCWGPREGTNPDVHACIDDIKTKSNSLGRWELNCIPGRFSREELRIYYRHPEYISDVDRSSYRDTPKVPLQPISSLLAKTAISVMRKGATLNGTVVDENGNPVAGAKVYDRPNYWEYSPTPHAVTDNEGRFQFKGFDNDWQRQMHGSSVFFTVVADGYAPELVPISGNDLLPSPLPLNDDVQHYGQNVFSANPIRAVLKPGLSAKGRVVDSSGNPVQGVSVRATKWRGVRDRVDIATTSGPTGRFELDGLPAEPIEFEFWKIDEYMASQGVLIQPVAKDTILAVENIVTMRPFLQVHGSVIDDMTEEPINQFQLLVGVDSEDGRAPHWFRDWRSDIEVMPGRFKKLFRQDDAWKIRIEAEGYMPEESKILRVNEANDSVFQVNFRLVKAETLTGRIVGEDGTPLENAKVHVATQRLNIADREVRSYEDRPPATTNRSGEFQLPPEVEPFYLVVVHESGVIALTEKEFKTGQDIQLKSWSNDRDSYQIIRRPATGQSVHLP